MTETETNGTTTSTVATIAPELQIVDGHVTTTSTQVSQHFGKAHSKVMRDIRNLLDGMPEKHKANFGLMQVDVEIGNGATRKDPAYRMTRDGFTLLAMGFTGKEALQWKLAYIDTFNKMEAALLVQPQPVSSLAPYSVHPGQTLSEDQAQTLRSMLDEFVKTLPKEKQGGFMTKGWSKLKAHFNVGYREIPAAKFTDAVSIIARHIVEYSTPVLEAPKQVELDFSIVSFKNQRLLHTIDHEGREHIQRMRNDQMLADFDEFAVIIKDHFLMPSMKQLASIVSAGVEAMAKRSGYGKAEAMPA